MCSKAQFSKREALAILSQNKHRPIRKYRKEIRAYQCPRCNYWHLTSQEAMEQYEGYDVHFKDKWDNLLNNKQI